MQSIAGANDGGTGAGSDLDPYAEAMAGAKRKGTGPPGARHAGSDNEEYSEQTPSFQHKRGGHYSYREGHRDLDKN